MNFTFENQGNNTYLVYEIAEDDCIDTMSLGMLTNNKIPGLAPAIFTQMDTTKFIKYNVSSHISVRQFFTGPVNKKRLIGVCNGIVDAMLSAEDYMIDEGSILLDLDYIFADVASCETILICLPLLDMSSAPVDLGLFFKNIIFSTQFDQTENCDHVAKLMNYLNSTPAFSLTAFKELLMSIDTASTPAVKVQPVVQNVSQQPVVNQAKVQQNNAGVQAAAPKPEAVKPQVQVNVPVSNPVAAHTEKKAVEAPVQKPEATAETGEKKMTMFDLLRNYSKDNAAKYKAQKEASKVASATAPKPEKQNGVPTPNGVPRPQGVPTPNGVPNPHRASAGNNGFAVPGKDGNHGFAVPGKSDTNVGFAVPGRPEPAATRVEVKAENGVEVNNTPAPVEQTANNTVSVSSGYTAPVAQQKAMNFGETTVLSGAPMGETSVLSVDPVAKQMPKPILIRIKNNEKINVDKPVFRIGKEKSYVDYFIADNSTISRSHANIMTKDGAYYIVDTNSTNHVYVNGQMIQSNAEVRINSGDRIKLSNEEFEFKIL
ncbi:MAG: FHA domain-containing protein [Clostridia bacterium]|nr:FHA domain-containing protein [Clostridia bacterium]